MQKMTHTRLLAQQLAYWAVLGGLVGLGAGGFSALFLVTLDWVTRTRLQNPWLIALLPLAGFVLVWVYGRFGGQAIQGNALVLEEIHTNNGRVPTRMAPMVLGGTLVTHLFGGSAGREGTAVQMGASIADTVARVLRVDKTTRRLLLMCGVSAGFGAVFGTPVAGFVFGMEVQSVGRIRYDGVIPCLIGAFVGDGVVRLLGVAHTHYPQLAHTEMDALLLGKVVVASVVFGFVSALFVELTERIKHLQARRIAYAPLRAVVGGVVMVGLTAWVGNTDYNGLGIPLIVNSVSGTGVIALAFLLKLVFTAVTLGSGFMGGEVTPLFVMGATLGYSVGHVLGVDPAWMASLGFVAVFAGASNTPLACALMGIELFGGGAVQYVMVACVVAFLVSGQRSIYRTQRLHIAKHAPHTTYAEDTLI